MRTVGQNLVPQLLLVHVSMGLERSRMIADRYCLVETAPIRNTVNCDGWEGWVRR